MTVLSYPCQPLVTDALSLARTWCAGHLIDAAPALGHAVKVALVVDRHITDAAPELIAAMLLHDAPYFAPDTVDLDAVLTGRFGAATTRIVRQLETEHEAMDSRTAPDVTGVDRWTLFASAADKIVSLGSILRRAARAPDPVAYWNRRAAFVDRVPYFVAFHTVAAPRLPIAMANELGRLTNLAERATAIRCAAPRPPGCGPPSRPAAPRRAPRSSSRPARPRPGPAPGTPRATSAGRRCRRPAQSAE
jgi:hypothetical protein